MAKGSRGTRAGWVGLVLAGAAWSLAAAGCTRKEPARAPAARDAAPAAAPAPPRQRTWAAAADTLPAGADLAPAERALQVVAGPRDERGEESAVDRWVARAAAKERGLTLVDLSDDWAPSIFADAVGADGKPLVNRYRRIFVGLANDRTDGDGQRLRPGERNYLEPYGIPPSLSVLRRRFLADGGAVTACFATVDRGKLLAVETVPTFGAASEAKERERERQRADKLEARRQEVGAATLEALVEVEPKLAKELAQHRRAEAERAAFAEAEKRLVCDGLLDPARHTAGRYDTAMRFAMLAFQQKHLVMAQGDISKGTLLALARPPLESDFLTLGRVLAERVADAGGFLEDGSATGSYRPAPDAPPQPIPDLVGEGTRALLLRLGIETPADALAFFRRRGAADFRNLVVAVRLPAPPPYYAAHMDLRATIDRGDVWYDFPFDGKGNRLPQPRTRYPSFTLSVRWQDQEIPLVRWRTTIGGWRSELASDGQEYLRYKESDVGARVWRHVIAAPVWVPPLYTPLGGFVKEKWVNGAIVKVPNHDEVGPGYLSAYGLVAGVHVEPRGQGTRTFFFDNGIRTHGTFDYTSLRGRFSHGCHRLENHLAVRVFSFVLRHREKKPIGPMPLDDRRRFFSGGEVFDLRLNTRGFYYELTPPLPVETLLGTIKGMRKQPIAGYLHKPGVVYARKPLPPASTGPEAKAGGAALERGSLDGVGAP